MNNFSVYQEIFLRSRIRAEILRLSTLVDAYRFEGIDSSNLLDNIFELKTLYRQLFGIAFRI